MSEPIRDVETAVREFGALPVPAGPEPQAPMSLKAARVRLAQYGERTRTWATATYDSGTEKALYEIAVTLDAALKSEHERHKAGLRRADEHVNAMNEELKRYAAGTETPVLWSVYNAMHLRAVNAETQLEQMRSRVAELESERHSTNESLSEAAEALRVQRDRIAELEKQVRLLNTQRGDVAQLIEREGGHGEECVDIDDLVAALCLGSDEFGSGGA